MVKFDLSFSSVVTKLVKCEVTLYYFYLGKVISNSRGRREEGKKKNGNVMGFYERIEEQEL